MNVINADDHFFLLSMPFNLPVIAPFIFVGDALCVGDCEPVFLPFPFGDLAFFGEGGVIGLSYNLLHIEQLSFGSTFYSVRREILRFNAPPSPLIPDFGDLVSSGTVSLTTLTRGVIAQIEQGLKILGTSSPSDGAIFSLKSVPLITPDFLSQSQI